MNSDDSNMAANAICFAAEQAKNEAMYALGTIQAEMTRPSVLYRPSIFRNYDDYIVRYSYIEVRGKTPDEAMRKFDKVWTEEVTGNPRPESEAA